MIKILMIAAFLVIAFSDYRHHIIPNKILIVLIGLSGFYKCIHFGSTACFTSLAGMALVFLLCAVSNFIIEKITGMESAGGGDLKLIAVMFFVLGMTGTLICLLVELTIESIYRYIIHPEKKNAPLPIGMPLSIMSAILIGGTVWL